MREWGLTAEEREIDSPERGPWGLHPALLAPHKVTTDEIHGDIYTTVLEQAIVDSPPFQRLRRVRQLGTTHLVYPGATHSRFSHSLGALRFVQDLLDKVISQGEGRHPVPDLLAQWRAEDKSAAAQQVAEAVVVARLGALLHDLGHVPFGHSLEDDLKVLVEHDANEERFQVLWGRLSEFVRDRVEREVEPKNAGAIASLATLLNHDGALHAELRPLIVSKGQHTKDRSQLKYPFAADLVGNTICADLLDYLLRDHLNAGLPIALGRRFISAFFVVPRDRGVFSQRLALNIVRDGHERTDVVTELLKALRYRYELSERALVHHGKLAADAMIGKALELWSDALWLQQAAPRVAEFDNLEELREQGEVALIKEAFDAKLGDEYRDDPAGTGRRVHEVDLAVRRRLEKQLLAHGDDGLLETLASFADASAGDAHVHAEGGFEDLVLALHHRVGGLAQAYLDRALFKVAGRVGVEDAPAEELWKTYGRDARKLSAVVREAQRFAGLGRDPKVLIWLPSPQMRVKIADVLVDDGRHVDRFAAYEGPRSGRGREIYGGHSRLWALWVFTHPRMEPERAEEVLAFLARRFGVAWERQREAWTSDYWSWSERLALARLIDRAPASPEVSGLLEREAVLQAATRASDETFATIKNKLSQTRAVRELKRASAAS